VLCPYRGNLCLRRDLPARRAPPGAPQALDPPPEAQAPGVLAPRAREAVDLRGLQAVLGRVAVGRAIARAAAARVDVPRAAQGPVRVALVAIAPLAAGTGARPVVRHVSGKIAARGRLDPEPVTPELAAPGLVAPIVVTVRRVSGKTVARVLVRPGLVAPIVVTVRPVSGKTAAPELVDLVLVAPAAPDVRNHRPVPFLVGRMVLSDVRSASRSAAQLDVAIEPVTMARSNVPSSIPRLTVRRSTPIERSGSTRVLSVMLLEAQPIRVAPNLRIVTAALSGVRARSTPMTANRRIDPPRSRLQASHRNGRAP